MPIAATVTTRELRNTETGLDLSVPQTEEIAGTLATTTLYQTIVITNLAVFKSPKHKANDVVQFMCSHKYAEFEALHKSLDEKFSGTALPTLPSRMVLKSSAAVTKERRNACDTFLRFIARTPKMATSPELLEFLGVSKSKSTYYLRKAEAKITPSQPEKKEDIFEEKFHPSDEDSAKPEDDQNLPKKVDIFGGDVGDDLDVDLFGQTSTSTTVDDDLFGAAPVKTGNVTRSQGVKLFEEEDEDQELFIPEGARVETKPEPTVQVEDNTDLLTIEDDLDKLLSISKEKPKPSPKPRPVPAPRPGKKPPTAPKPNLTKTARSADDLPGSDVSAVESMGDDDIMKYIQMESNQQEDDLNLF
ncbi:PREDICTED: HCLS1-binding protein 3-like isoform X1 [Branchiostoma belcheri]|uniref:HCLS1-binding protein 3-like isoform X1 n=2 Tax=Branchiostoma belcheri TaxID=7741 RepID=A0A6P4Z8U1_BRABE|nr:PREDICTED: HCLS1-binding protein 3-like isoform X1 [Branchiostoma belcheri]